MRTRPPITRLVCRVFAALTLLPALIAVNLVVAPVAEAATTVNIANGDVASFENAIYAANAGTPQIINLAAGGDYVLTTAFYDSYVANFSGLPEITGDVTIHGNGATIERSTAATDKFGILDVAGSGTLKIDTTTITGGNNDNGYYKNGGGIYNNGTLIVTNCTISNNSAPGGGGGIYNYGSATVIGSTIANNTAGSTASNSAGGGFDNVGSAAIIANSTIIGNFANYGGGGISSINNMSVINSTITGNTTSDFGDGILGLAGGVVTVTNSIVAGNGTVDVYGTVTNGGHNLIGGNPLLNPLASDGGPTQTMSLQSSSPAIDAGDDTICAANPVNGIDQRGYSRPAGLHCDIGAYEYGASISPTFTFDLSTLGSKTYGDASFSVAGYATEP
ncbi:MAG TPA: choice-of-anchor Q domain-containing protein, partial [Nitrolancea sp.]